MLTFQSAKSILLTSRLPFKNSQKPSETLSLIRRMASWACAKCTYVNPSYQKLNCEVCLSAKPQSLPSSSLGVESKWACASCTFLNRYRGTICEICGTRASASLLSALEVDFDDPDEARLGSSVGSVFFPLQSCRNNKKIDSEKSEVTGDGSGCSGKLKGVATPSVGNDDVVESDSGGDDKGFPTVLRSCNKKRKYGEDGNATKPVEVISLDGTDKSSVSKTWKVLSYNIWFREDVEMRNRMKALGNLIRLHSPDVICLQEVTPNFYDIFQHTNWWKEYKCSIPDIKAVPGAYFCMQLSKLPVKSYACRPFHNSIMGRELCIAELNVHPNLPLVVATSHLESPCPAPPTWNQMFSKERMQQANEAVKVLENYQNVIFCGDMNWDDKLDGPFPLPEGWVDAWTELKPGEPGWTYDTKSNKMLTGNRTLQKRLDRMVCRLRDFKINTIEMIGKDPILELSYLKEKKVKGQVKELELPVLPSDHYGVLLTISTK